MKKEYIIPIFVPHLGCPQCCTFCNQRTISGEQKQVTAQDVKNTIEYYLESFKEKNKYVEVAFFGGSFTAIEVEKQKELLEAVQPYIKEKKVDSIRLSTRPDIKIKASSDGIAKAWPDILGSLKNNGRIVLYTNLINTQAKEINDMTVGIEFKNGISESFANCCKLSSCDI